MKIAIDARALAIRRKTGVGEYVFELLNTLFKIDKDNQYILFNNSFLQKNSELKKFSEYPNVKIINLKIPNKIFNSALAFLNYPKLDKICGTPDVFLSPSWNFCKISNKTKRILTVHDLSFEISPDFFPFKKKIWHKMIQTKKQAESVHKIIAVSESTKEDLKNIYNIDPEKIKVIYPGINKRFFEKCSKEKKDLIKSKYGLPPKFIYFIGTIEPRKGLINLIKAFEHFKKSDLENIDLVISGTCGWSYKEILKEINNSAYRKNIKLTGYIDDEDKPAIIQLSQLFIYPSFYEGFGFPPLEAMACEIPVIVSHNPSLPEITEDAALMINPWNLEEFSWAIKEGLYNNKLREILIEKGKEHVRRFSWENAAKQTLRVLLNDPY